eukprot:9202083-Pyramimonas_sp.AAC.1
MEPIAHFAALQVLPPVFCSSPPPHTTFSSVPPPLLSSALLSPVLGAALDARDGQEGSARACNRRRKRRALRA